MGVGAGFLSGRFLGGCQRSFWKIVWLSFKWLLVALSA